MVTAVVEVPGFACDACDDLVQESELLEGECLYECSSCGNTFVADSNLCEQCHKFSVKVSSAPCPHCRAGELTGVGVVYLSDGELYESREEAVKVTLTSRFL